MAAHMEMTAEQCRQAAEEYKSAAGHREKGAIAQKYGLSTVRLWDWVHRGLPKRGYKSRPGSSKSTDLAPEERARRDAIIAEYNAAPNGTGAKEAVAKKHGVPLKTIYWWAGDRAKRGGMKGKPYAKKNGAAVKPDALVVAANKALQHANGTRTTAGPLIQEFLRRMRDMGLPISSLTVDASETVHVHYKTTETFKL